jgi:hypothetical protein
MVEYDFSMIIISKVVCFHCINLLFTLNYNKNLGLKKLYKFEVFFFFSNHNHTNYHNVKYIGTFIMQCNFLKKYSIKNI